MEKSTIETPSYNTENVSGKVLSQKKVASTG